jgi:predicted DCC family thiol-disulfide oxidoreductase YuxK
MRLALSRGALEILPCRSEPRRRRYPQIAEEACLTAMQLVLPDGRVLAGADAVPELLRRIRGLGWVATVFALPGVRSLSRRVYAWIAANRLRISCALGPRGPRQGRCAFAVRLRRRRPPGRPGGSFRP